MCRNPGKWGAALSMSSRGHRPLLCVPAKYAFQTVVKMLLPVTRLYGLNNGS